MRLSDIKGEKAFEVLADILDPLSVMATDEDIRKAAEKTYLKAVQVALRKYPQELTTIIATLDLQDPATYEVSLATLPRKVLEVVNDPDVRVLFMSQGQQMEETSTGSATENTVESDK